MDLPHIIAATLGLSTPWSVRNVVLAEDGRRLDIIISYDAGSSLVCPLCGGMGAEDAEDAETWYHHDFFRFPTYLHTRVPRITCCGRNCWVERPWARPGSKFVRITGAEPPTAR